MAGEVKLKDIAQELGVSIVTVSNALSGKKGVSRAVRLRVEEKAEELGYNILKYKKKDQLSTKIGVIVSEEYLEVGSSFYWSMYQRVAYAASLKQSFTIFEIIPRGVSEKNDLPRILDEKIDGLLVIGTVEQSYIKKVMEASKVPVVLLDFRTDDFECDAIMSHNYLGMYQMTRYLLERGHRKIAFLGNVMANENIMDRYFGYRKAMQEYQVRIEPEWVIDDRDAVTGEIHFDLPDTMPTAFACNCDYAAGKLYDRLIKAGYSVPDDVSIVGYDNYLYGHPFAKEITTYGVDLDRMAEAAIRAMLKKLKNPDRAYRIRYIEGKVLERNSVKTINE